MSSLWFLTSSAQGALESVDPDELLCLVPLEASCPMFNFIQFPCAKNVLIFEWLCFKEARSVCAYLLKIGWVTHEKTFWKVSQLLLVVLIPEILNIPGQRFKLLRSGAPLSTYGEKLVIIVWFIVSSCMLHFCWHRQSCIDSTQSASHLVVCWHSLVSSDIPLSMYMDMSQNEVSVFRSKMVTLSEKTDTTF